MHEDLIESRTHLREEKRLPLDLIKTESQCKERRFPIVALRSTARSRRSLGCASAKRHELPTDFSVRDFKPGHAWRRTAVGPGHAAGIEKQNATAPFVARDVRVPVQENIDIIRRIDPAERVAGGISTHLAQGREPTATRNCCRNFRAQRSRAVRSPAVRRESFPRKHRQDARSHQRLWPSPSRSPADDCVSARTKMRQASLDFSSMGYPC